MNERNSRLTKSQREISKRNHNPTEKCDLGCPLPKSNKVARGSCKANMNPIVETNLKTEDLDFLSTEMGDEIARIVVDEIVSLQSLKYGAFTKKPADNFI